MFKKAVMICFFSFISEESEWMHKKRSFLLRRASAAIVASPGWKGPDATGLRRQGFQLEGMEFSYANSILGLF